MSLKYLNKIDNKCIVSFLLIILPIIDSINGYLGGGVVGTLYKIFLCSILLIITLRNDGGFKQRYIKYILLIVAYTLFSVSINIILSGELANLQFVFKFFFNIALLGLLMNNIESNFLSSDIIFLALDYGAWVFLGCYYIPYVLGVGSHIYGNGMGYKAFYISQNELSLIVIILTFFSIYKLEKRITGIEVVKYALLFLCGIFINTKSTIIACLLGSFIWIIDVIRKGKIQTKFFILSVIGLGCFVLKNKIYGAIEGVWSRFVLLREKHYGGSSLTGILSGRNIYATEAIDKLRKEFTIFRFFFGNGFCSNILTEMDVVDVFFYLGIIGVVIVMIFLLAVLKKSMLLTKNDKTYLRPFSFVLLIGFLNLTGHVLFMATSGTYFILYCCFLMQCKYLPQKTKNKI